MYINRKKNCCTNKTVHPKISFALRIHKSIYSAFFYSGHRIIG